MSTSRIVRLAVTVCMFCMFPLSATAVFGASTPTSEKVTAIERDVAVIKETTSLKLEVQKEGLQKDLQNMQSKVEQQDKRIADINAATDRLAIILTLLSTLITVLAFAVGAAAWYSAGIKAKEAAQEWITRHEGELIEAVRKATDEVQVVATKATKVMNEHEDTVADKAKTVIEQLPQNLTSATTPTPTPAQKEALNAQAELLKQKPESGYTFSDWESRAYTAYASKQLDLASNFFLQASTAPTASLFQVARSLFGRGAVLGQLNRGEEAIAVYDQLIARFGEATEPALREQVARAMVNKGVSLDQLKRGEEADRKSVV